MAYRWLEQPIDPFLSLADTARLNLPEASKEPLRQAIWCLVANAILAAMKDVPAVHYSRDNTFYAQPTSSIPTWCSRRNVVAALELLVDAGLLASMPTKPGSNNRHRSSFSASPLLGERTASMTVDDLVQLDRPPVELRDRDTDVVIHPSQWGVQDRQILHKIGQDVQAQNALLRGTRIELTGKYPRTGHGLIAVQHRFINPRKCTLKRVFRANSNLGGRWYGGWWQNLPKSARAHLLINEKRVVEVDYSACQLRLTYASVGQPDPLAGEVDQRDLKIDLYAGIGMDRDVAKQAFLIMINARHQLSAERALAKWFRDNDRFLNEDKPLELAKCQPLCGPQECVLQRPRSEAAKVGRGHMR